MKRKPLGGATACAMPRTWPQRQRSGRSLGVDVIIPSSEKTLSLQCDPEKPRFVLEEPQRRPKPQGEGFRAGLTRGPRRTVPNMSDDNTREEEGCANPRRCKRANMALLASDFVITRSGNAGYRSASHSHRSAS